jgi:hypothetical protein
LAPLAALDKSPKTGAAAETCGFAGVAVTITGAAGAAAAAAEAASRDKGIAEIAVPEDKGVGRTGETIVGGGRGFCTGSSTSKRVESAL